MNRFPLIVAGFIMALALVAAAPGTAGAVAFDVGSGYLQTLPTSATNYITVTAGGPTITLGGELTIGYMDLTSTTGQTISNGVLTFGANLSGPSLPTQGSANYAIQSAGSWITLSGTTAGGQNVSFSGTFASGSLSYTDITVGGITYYTSNIVNSYYNASNVSPDLVSLLGISGASFTGGLLNLTESNAATVSGTVTTGTGATSTPVPIPPALLLFAPAVFGLTGIRRRFAKQSFRA
jgi:hypothetical protein